MKQHYSSIYIQYIIMEILRKLNLLSKGIAVLFVCCFPIKSALACDYPIYPITISSDTINTDPSVPVGSQVGSVNFSWPDLPYNQSCIDEFSSLVDHTVNYTVKGEGIPVGNLYPTNIAGIAYRIIGTREQLWGYDEYLPTSHNGHLGAGPIVTNGTARLEFVKIGPTSAGGNFGPQVVMRQYINGIEYVNFMVSTTIHVEPEAPACTITQSAIQVSMNDVNQAELNLKDKTAKPYGFNIPINCRTSANIGLGFSGDTADAANGIFRNTVGGGASNVGIQLLDGVTPISTVYGQFINIGMVTGSFSFPMTARYYALSNDVGAGAVNSVAYVTVIYN